MTYEEKIKDAIGCIKRHRRGLSDYNGDWSFFDTAIEALEKQMPKKPTKGKYGHIECACCGWIVESFCGDIVQYSFCPNCGQAIDWSENEET